jgi:hypothetical protein
LASSAPARQFGSDLVERVLHRVVDAARGRDVGGKLVVEGRRLHALRLARQRREYVGRIEAGTDEARRVVADPSMRVMAQVHARTAPPGDVVGHGGSSVPRTQRSAPFFTAWCAAKPGPILFLVAAWVPALRCGMKNAAARPGQEVCVALPLSSPRISTA